MHTVKRIEIVIGKPHVKYIRKLLRDFGAPGLTVLDAATGYGDRGNREGGELSDAMVNAYLLTTCQPDQIEDFAAALEPILVRYGGLCLISDAAVIRDDQ